MQFSDFKTFDQFFSTHKFRASPFYLIIPESALMTIMMQLSATAQLMGSKVQADNGINQGFLCGFVFMPEALGLFRSPKAIFVKE